MAVALPNTPNNSSSSPCATLSSLPSPSTNGPFLMSQVPHVQLPSIQLSVNYDNPHADDALGLANSNIPALPSLWGIPLKYISLVALAVQNSALTIIMHYSRISTPPSRTYSAATAVLMNEIIKGVISFIIAFARIKPTPLYTPPDMAPAPYSSQRFRESLYRSRKMGREIFSSDCWKLSIPAILYVIQNNLQYVAASHLDAATFQVTYQMKILTTAVFSVLLLRKKLTINQWMSLLFLAIGVGVVQIQVGSHKSAPILSISISQDDVFSSNAVKGFAAVTAACFTSGLAGVYFEMVLKNSQADLWVRNVQLSLFSLLPALAPIIFAQRHEVGQGSLFALLFHNFGAWAWATVWMQVAGGLVTALVIKHSDNILKGFATSLSIVVSFLASVALFDFHVSLIFMLGSSIVLVSTWLYNQQPRRAVGSSGAFKQPSFLTWAARNEKTNDLPMMHTPSFSVLPTNIISSRSSSTSSLASLSTVTHTPLADYGRSEKLINYFR